MENKFLRVLGALQKSKTQTLSSKELKSNLGVNSLRDLPLKTLKELGFIETKDVGRKREKYISLTPLGNVFLFLLSKEKVPFQPFDVFKTMRDLIPTMEEVKEAFIKLNNVINELEKYKGVESMMLTFKEELEKLLSSMKTIISLRDFRFKLQKAYLSLTGQNFKERADILKIREKLWKEDGIDEVKFDNLLADLFDILPSKVVLHPAREEKKGIKIGQTLYAYIVLLEPIV